MKTLLRAAACAAAIGVANMAGGAAAADAEAGREEYLGLCIKCHGLLKNDPDSWTPHNLASPAIASPQGPPLVDVFGRPAGIIDFYRYSRAFRAALENPWEWDADALDYWVADSQAFISGSTMFVKLPDDTARANLVAYLEKYAPWIPDAAETE